MNQFIKKMMNIFLEKKRGYSQPWLRLPSDSKSLLKMSTELETELNMNKWEPERQLEIFRMLLEISNRLKNYQDVIMWGDKYLEIDPEDSDVLTLMALHYFNLKDFENFLEMFERLRKEVRHDLIVIPLVLQYYTEISIDLNKALDVVEAVSYTHLTLPTTPYV